MIQISNAFLDGFERSAKIRSELVGTDWSASYIQRVSDAIDQANIVIGELNGSPLLVDQLKGFVAERWHAGTFSIDAVLDRSKERVFLTDSNIFASPDIITSWGEEIQLKYHMSPQATAKAQSLSYEEHYRRAVSGKAVKPSIEEFYSQKNIHDIDSKTHQSIYQTQTRIVPSDQYENIGDELRKMESAKVPIRSDLADKYRETNQNLADRISSPEGNESIPLSEEGAKTIAEDLKRKEYDGEKYGLSTNQIVKFEHIINEAIKAGATAAVITAVAKGVPDIIELFRKALKQEDITLAEFAEKGFGNLSASTQSFIRGSLAAALCGVSKSGLAGEFAKHLNPTMIGVMTAVTFNIVENSVKLAKGRITSTEFSNECLKDVLVGSLAGIGSIAFQAVIPFPVLGLLIGSLVGSMVGAFTYSACNKLILKLASESGLTYFNLVEQDYSLPTEVLEFMGLKVIHGKVIEPKVNIPITHEPIMANPILSKPKRNLPYIISRGVIGVNRIGYLVSK